MKKFWLIALITLFAVIATACGSDDSDDSKGSSSDDKKDSKEVTINQHIVNERADMDEKYKVTLDANPKKVAVFDFGMLDTLDKLGIEVEGVSQNTIPPYLDKYKDDKYTNIGSLKEPDFEALSEMAPDVILISGRQASQYDELSKIAPTVYLGVDSENYMESFKENMDKVGKIFTDKQDDVKKEVKKIEDQIKETKEKAEKSGEKALIVLANDDKMSAYGPKSRFGIIHDVLGVEAADTKIEASTHGQNISSEYIKKQNPDILYVVDRGTAIGEGEPAKEVVENKVVKTTDVYKNDKIVYLDPYLWYLAGGGLESVPKMIDEINESLD